MCCDSGWTAGVDGFRIDVAHMLMKDPELRDNPPNPNPEPNPFELQDPEFYSQLHVYDRLHPGPARCAPLDQPGAGLL